MLVLGKKKAQLWQFTPTPLRLQWPYRPKPWQALTHARAFRQPRSLAVSNDRWWVLDASGVKSGSLADPGVMHPVVLAALKGRARILAAADARTLIVATRHRVSAWRRQTDSSYTRSWSTKRPFGQIAALAANRRFIAVADSRNQTIVLLDVTSGRTQALLTPAAVPGGMHPTGLALHGHWLLVVDSQGHRLLRFDIHR